MGSSGSTPLQAAFSLSAAALLLLVAGSQGYTIGKSNWSFVSVTWAGHVVWWEIRLGLVLAAVAVFFWHRGLRALP